MEGPFGRVLESPPMRTHPLLPILLLGSLPLGAAELPEVLVTAKPPVPGTVVLAGDDLKASPGDSLVDVLVWSGETDVARRGTSLADLNFRASTFEQTGIFLDGFPLRDPQTGHFNLDLPFPPLLLDRVEFSPVPWGGRGLAGSVDFVTRPPVEKKVALSGASGSFGTSRGTGLVVLPPTALWGRASRSDGDHPGTDAQEWAAGGSLRLRSLLDSRVTAAWSDRRFGANDFYGNYPKYEEWEATENHFASWKGRAGMGEGVLEPGLYWRRHRDRFRLDRYGRSAYENRHTSQVFGTGTRYHRGPFRADLHGKAERLASSNLGRRERGSGGISGFITHESVSLGLETDLLGRGTVQASPLLAAHTRIMPDVSLTGSITRSHREASFTELYYRDPQNVGTADLRSETAWSYALIPDWKSGAFSAGGMAFLRLERDLIDWVRPEASQPWRSLNIGTAIVRGAGSRVESRIGSYRLRAGYDFLERDADLGGMQSKYALNYPRHRVDLRGHATVGIFGVSARSARFWRTDRQCYNLVEGRITVDTGLGILFASGANMLDTEYREIATVPMPGRSLECGAELSF